MVLAFEDSVWDPSGGWRELAACDGMDSDMFFPVGEEPALATRAKAVCASCPVAEDCLQYALSTNQSEGVWGGMTGAERRRLRRRLREQEKRAS